VGRPKSPSAGPSTPPAGDLEKGLPCPAQRGRFFRRALRHTHIYTAPRGPLARDHSGTQRATRTAQAPLRSAVEDRPATYDATHKAKANERRATPVADGSPAR
jgi:hypothetical protein